MSLSLIDMLHKPKKTKEVFDNKPLCMTASQKTVKGVLAGAELGTVPLTAELEERAAAEEEDARRSADYHRAAAHQVKIKAMQAHHRAAAKKELSTEDKVLMAAFVGVETRECLSTSFYQHC
jgi:hypothetical protein